MKTSTNWELFISNNFHRNNNLLMQQIQIELVFLLIFLQKQKREKEKLQYNNKKKKKRITSRRVDVIIIVIYRSIFSFLCLSFFLCLISPWFLQLLCVFNFFCVAFFQRAHGSGKNFVAIFPLFLFFFSRKKRAKIQFSSLSQKLPENQSAGCVHVQTGGKWVEKNSFHQDTGADFLLQTFPREAKEVGWLY